MKSRTKKMKHSKGINGVQDRLSDMPDDLIVHILSFLPTLDAVKTMLLRRFENLWTLVPALSFDFVENDECKKLTTLEVFSGFSGFVRNVLMLHRSPTIDRFDLSIRPLEWFFLDHHTIQYIQMWLRFAIDKQVKYLDFVFRGFDDLMLPHCVATSQSLTKLELSGCVLEDQPLVNVHMKSLRKLLLCDVRGSNEAFNQLIAGCTFLQELILETVHGLNVLNVTSPSVSKLSLTIQLYPWCDSFTLTCPNVKILDICVSSSDVLLTVNAIDVSSLQVVNVKGLSFHNRSLTEAFLSQFLKVEVFTLSMDAYQNLCCWVYNFDFPVTRWKRIVLWPYWEAKNCLQVFLALVKSSAELEELIIYNKFESLYDLCATRNPQLSTTSVMPRLKNVTIQVRGRCTKVQLQLIELLLGNAVVLEKLVITFEQKRPTTVEEVDFVEQVSRFRRAAANAIVIFA